MPPHRRAAGILVLIGLAEIALLLFGFVPRPLHVVCLFFNGLPLGMIYGLVVGFLEGRRHTEAVTAGLCASFILADGVTKSVGTWFLDRGVTDRWMPSLAGLCFVPPLLVFVWMLTRIPPPAPEDVAHRSERPPIGRSDRLALFVRYAAGLGLLIGSFLLVTILRSLRADFAPELWKGLGVDVAPATFSVSEALVALGVLAANALSILIVDNRRAFYTAIGVSVFGNLLLLAALVGLQLSHLGGFPFMVLVGLGLYLPYVAMHTTIFERLIAMGRDRANLGFLMYVADSVGYLGYVAILLGKGLLPSRGDFLGFFTAVCWLAGGASCACLVASVLYFATRAPKVDRLASDEIRTGANEGNEERLARETI
jgi:hypothetical protein